MLLNIQIRSLIKYDIYWYCAHCCDIFPFSSLNEEEILYLNTNRTVKEKLCGLYNTCSNFDFKIFNYNECKT